MKKILFFIIIIALAALFLAPESMIGEYKGLLKVKHTLRDTGLKVKNIVTDFAVTGEKPAELDALEKSAKEKLDAGTEQLKKEAKEAAKDAAKETIESL